MKAQLFIILILCLSLPVIHAEETNNVFQAGVTQVTITPPQGYRMSGYFHERLNRGTHDPLLAKIMVFKQGKTEIALIFCDIIGISPELSSTTRKAAAKKTGIPRAHILIAATHSHTGPLYFGALRDHFHEKAADQHGRDPCEPLDYTAWLRDRIVDGIRSAQKLLKPVDLLASVTQENGLTFNRRFHMDDGTVRFNPGKGNPHIVRPAGPVDPDVSVLLLRNRSEQVATLTNFALHLDTVGGIEYSADYPVYLSRKLKDSFGEDFISVFATGTCGDLNHIDVSHKNPQKGHTEAERIGSRLSAAVKRALKTAQKETPLLGAAAETIKVPLQTFPDEVIRKAEEDLNKVGTRELPFLKQVHAYKICAIKARKDTHIPLEVQVFRFSSDTALVGLPGEVFVDLGQYIKKHSPFKTTFVVELSNDAPGYIPTTKAFKEGSYETVNSRIQPGGGERMAQTAVELLTRLAAAPTNKPPKQQVIRLDIPAPEDSAGGIIVADVTGDGAMDYLVTIPGHLAVYRNDGSHLWTKKLPIVVGASSEREGLPGHHGPGVAAGDIDGDNVCEVVFLTKDGFLHVVNGSSGKTEWKARPPVPDGAQRWELAMLCDLHGTGGDGDLLLQATNTSGYRMGKYLAAYRFSTLKSGGEPLWTTDKFLSCAHNGARIADLNGDKKDEILGATIFSSTGRFITRAVGNRWHMDSIFVSDVKPDLPHLEVVMLEEGANNVQLIGLAGPIWRHHFKHQEPQNAAVGRFASQNGDISIWCRSRYNEHQKPFVFDKNGKVIFTYEMDDLAPKGWTTSGVEVIHAIDWTGGPRQLACAKERHTTGDVCLFEPLTGKFILTLEEKADRLYVADVSGDWREEIIVLNGNELHIYENRAPNPQPGRKRLWTNRNYRRLKQCHNYYSP